MKTQQRNYARRIGLLWPCVLLTSMLPEETRGEYPGGICYIQVYQVLNGDGEYLARIAADPAGLAEGTILLLTEEQLWYALPFDIRLSALTPARLRTLLRAHGDDLRPPRPPATSTTPGRISPSERVAEESGAFSQAALRLAESDVEEMRTLASVQPQQEEETHGQGEQQVSPDIQSLYLPSEVLEEMLTAQPLPRPFVEEGHLKKCVQCRSRWLHVLKSRLPQLLNRTLLPVLAQLEWVCHTLTEETMQQILDVSHTVKQLLTEMRLPEVILHISTGYQGGKKAYQPRGWLLGIAQAAL